MIEFEKFNSKTSAGNIPDMTPLIDMVFLLLIFFLLTSYLSSPAIAVDLPDAENTETADETNPVIIIKTDGSLFLDDKTVSEIELKDFLIDYAKMNKENEVIIQADKIVPFERVIDVMDISRDAGIYSISFLVEKNEQ